MLTFLIELYMIRFISILTQWQLKCKDIDTNIVPWCTRKWDLNGYGIDLIQLPIF